MSREYGFRRYGDPWEMKLSEKLDYADELKAVVNKRFTSFQFGWALVHVLCVCTCCDQTE